MAVSYLVPDLPPDGVHQYEETVHRSRFLISLAHTPDPDTAKIFIERIRQKYSDATHNCWAYVAGPPGNTARIGYSDDGEPHGTAGRPMLSVLLHGDIGELTAVVTRYFGGIKLGTGGLVRAYQSMVKQGLETLPLRDHMIPVCLEVILDYTHITPFLRLLPLYKATLAEESFGADATYKVLLPEQHLVMFTNALTELTDGAVLISFPS